MNLLEHETYTIFEKNGIKTPFWRFFERTEEPGLPPGKKYVAKISDRSILHKSDCNGIVFGVTEKNAADVHKNMIKRFPGAEGVLYVEQLPYERSSEIIVGAYIDPFFGPLITLGFGGTGTDIFNNVMKRGQAKAFIPANLGQDRVRTIIERLPVVRMVTGNARGYNKLAGLEDILATVSAFQKMITYGEKGHAIEEIEINPLVAYENGLYALDGVCRTTETPTKKAKKPIYKIGDLLNPSSACIVGASGKNPSNPANVILKNLLTAGLGQQEMFVIHPKEEYIEGVKCTPSLAAMMEERGNRPVDLLVVGIPAKSATDLIEESFELNAAKAIQVISAGFGETEGGRQLQEKLEKRLHELDMTPEKRPVINGPNTLGNIYLNKKTLFTAPRKSSGTGKGHTNAALICQSGAFMITAISNLAGILSPKAAVSVGNQMDITVIDCLEHLLDDRDIRTYGLYIEGLKENDGLNLMDLSRNAREKGKFIVVYKAGRTKEGADAAKGHTASMAGDYGMFEDLMELGGVIMADTFMEFQNLLMLTSLVKPVKKTSPFNIAALSNAGYEKCAIADHLMCSGTDKFGLAGYSNETIGRLKDIYGSHRISGIMDIHDILDLTPMMDDAGYEEMIRATLSDANIGFGIYSIVPETLMLNICEAGSDKEENDKGILARLIRINKDTDKPFVLSIESGWKYDGFAAKCIEAGIPCFRRVDAASRAVRKLLMSAL